MMIHRLSERTMEYHRTGTFYEIDEMETKQQEL